MNILAAKSKSKKDLLVHQQLRYHRNGQHYQIAGNSRGDIDTSPFVCKHNQVVTTAQEPKGLSCSTKGKLVGMVRRLQIETIRSQVLTCPEKDSMNAVQRLNGNGLRLQKCSTRLKIESVPTEMWSSRGMKRICCYTCQESLKGYLTYKC